VTEQDGALDGVEELVAQLARARLARARLAAQDAGLQAET
jgi:hypothetical protein